MISSRGPNNVLVVERSCVPVFEVCESVTARYTVDDLKARYQVTEDEIFECIDAFSDLYGPSSNDFIEFDCTESTKLDFTDLDVDTVAVSDWVFLTIITYGRTLNMHSVDFSLLYEIGIEAIFVDCLRDIARGSIDYSDISAIHSIVFNSFETQVQSISKQQAKQLLEYWGKADNEDD